MTDNWSEDAMKDYKPDVVEVAECEGWLQEAVQHAAELQARIAELERREAGYQAVIHAFDWWRQRCEVCDTEGCVSPENLWPLVDIIEDKRKALDWLPTEPVDAGAEADELHDCDKEYRADCASCNGVSPGDAGTW